MAKRVWDTYQGCFVSEEAYAKSLSLRPMIVDDLTSEPEPEPYVKLKGDALFKGHVATKVVEHLNELGYKQIGGELIALLPDDKTYDEFVTEAIYWYLRQTGLVNLGK